MIKDILRDYYVRFLHKLEVDKYETMKETQAFIRKLKSKNRPTNYEVVKSLITSMKSNEFKFAKNYLMMLHNAEGETQPIRLFRYIKENPESTEQEARIDFAKNGKTNFDKTLTVLKKRLCWSLVSEYNTQREDAYSHKWKTTFEIMNNLMTYYVIMNRQIPAFAYDLLTETIQKAKEVEAYKELTLALELKIRHIKFRSETRQIARLEEELTYYKKCDQNLNEAARIYIELTSRTRMKGGDKGTLLSDYEKGLAKLLVLHKQTNSDSILYYYFFIEASVYQLQKNYTKAGKIFFQLDKILKTSPVLNNKQNLGRSALDIANNYVHDLNFEVALTFTKKAKSFFSESSFNHLQAEFLEFYIHFYTNSFYAAEKKISSILSNKSYRESEFAVNTKRYLLGCSFFAQEKYNDALAVFTSLEKIWTDTTGWNIGIRIMLMLCYKMMGNYELMAVERERFRGLFDRYRHRKGIRERDRIILKIVHEFLKKNSDFKSVYQRKKNLFEKLDQPEYTWEVMSHEMIDFKQWFICTMNKKQYRLEN